MHLLVANGTHQHHEFQYRVPEFDKVFSTTIQAGRQVQLPVDFNERQLQEVITQLERYGAMPVSDVDSLSTPRGLVFSVRKPISADKIDQARERDVEVRQKISDEQVENAGVAVFTPALGDHMASSTLEVRELEPTAGETPVRGGVDTKVTVSKRASGPRQRSRG